LMKNRHNAQNLSKSLIGLTVGLHGRIIALVVKSEISGEPSVKP
jgi:hypothetical protein